MGHRVRRRPGSGQAPLKGPGATRWTHWLACPAITYPKQPTKPPAPQPAAFSVGDRVRVRPGAKSYRDVPLASWVSGGEYTVLEPPQGDRVVIGRVKVVTAAVRAQDLTRLS